MHHDRDMSMPCCDELIELSSNSGHGDLVASTLAE